MAHRPAALALLLLTLPALAGCIAPQGEPRTTSAVAGAARLLCQGEVCNFQATVDPPERQANELSIAVNPLDPLNLIATGKDYTPEHAGDCVWDGLYVTKDGGRSWVNLNLPGSPWKRLRDPSEPLTEFSTYWCATDPVVRFGPDGTAYWTVMPYQCDAASGSKLGRGVVPQGGFNDWLWTCVSMYVLVSKDGGMTWPTVRRVAFGERLVHDKQWLAVHPNGQDVLLCWRYASSAAALDGEVGTVCSVSRDQGDTWSAPTYTGHAIFRPWVDYGPDGTAWMAANGGEGLRDVVVLRSDDGLVWSEPVVVATFEESEGGGEHGRPVLRGSEFRVVPLPSMAVDRSQGPFSGRVYVTWYDHAAGNGDVFLAWSGDGVQWSAPVRVHDDGPSPHDQFMPTVSVGPDGIVDVSWWDRRDDPANHLFHLYYAYSTDGGATLSPNLRVSEVPSDEQYSHHQNGMVFLGDYRDSASSQGMAHLVWVDTRNQKADVFVANVARP